MGYHPSFYFFDLSIIHFTKNTATAIAATLSAETATVVAISGIICSGGIVVYIAAMSFFDHINTMNASDKIKIIILHGFGFLFFTLFPPY
jgi:hypothetical protein